MLRAPRRSRRILLAVPLFLALRAGAGDAPSGALERWRSERLTASRAPVRLEVARPRDWLLAATSERVRFYPPEAPGPRSSATFIDVDALARDEGGLEALLAEKDGLERWVTVTRPRYRIEDRRRVKVGVEAVDKEALVVVDPADRVRPDRCELITALPVGELRLLVRLSAPKAEFQKREPLFRDVLASLTLLGE